RVYTNNLHITPEDRLTLLSSYSFDAAVMDIFGALLNGATLYPIDVKQEGLPYLSNYLNQEKITIYHSTPTLYRYLLASVEDEWASADLEIKTVTFPNARLVVLGGEAVKRQDVDSYRKHFSESSIFINGLGPSESTVTLQQFIAHTTPVHLSNVSVGRPVEETKVLLLNEAGENAQLYGEIAIRSEYVALGYWRRPELTKKAFLADMLPVSQASGGEKSDNRETAKRIYRTGDLGRLKADGTLEFLGRKDFQIKLRGFRIELGEIESVLAQHEQIEKVVVVGRENESGDSQLVAYAVTSRAVDVTELRQFAQKQLPSYMVPAAFVFLASLPLTPSGKIDRLALPAPDFDQQAADADRVLPRTATEQKLLAIWCELLKRENISVLSNFFDLGGHSLLATQVASRVREAFNVELSLRYLFESPTIATLSQVIQERSQAEDTVQIKRASRERYRASSESSQVAAVPSAASIQPAPREQLLPLSFAQQRLWFLDQLEETSSAYVLSQVIVFSRPLNLEALKGAIATLYQRHETLRTHFETAEGTPHQIVNPEISVTLPLVDLQSYPEDNRAAEISRLTQQTVNEPFDLSAAPLVRFQLFKLSPQSHRLLIAIHHVISDGWSMGIFVQELLSSYTELARQKTPTLPPLPIQYADFAYWQRQWLQGAELDRQLGYWQQKLSGAPPLLTLPTDYPRPAVQTTNGATATFELTPQLSQQLSELSRRSGATLYMTLLSAFSIFLSRYSQTTDIVVGSPIANRNRKEIEPLIGFFANTLLMRTEIERSSTFAALLEQVKQTALDAYAHQDMPFEKLVEVLRPERNRSYNPLFQVMFVLQNQSVSTTESTAKSESSELKRTTAKFDLNLSIVETQDGLRGSWTYSTDLFKPETIEKMSGQFQALLADIVRSPQKPIDALSMLSESEQKAQMRDRKLQSQIAKLSPAKRALLERKLRSKYRTDTIVPRTQKGETALSFAQQNLWLLDQLTPGNPGYNRPTHIRITGELDITALEKSLTALIHRHEILKTRFTTSVEGKPVQSILAEVPAIALHTENITQLPDAQQQQIIQERAIAQAHTKFDLTQAPLLKAQLLQLSAESHILLLTFHHIVFDGWSTSILLKDLGAFYDAFSTGKTPALPTLPVQYADFALWQQQQLQTAQMDKQLAYWKKQLGGQLPILELPTDRPRTANLSANGGGHTFSISQALKVELSAIAQQENATLFMVLLAAFKTLLYRYTQVEDIIIGSPIAGRNTVETEQLIGLFANTLVLRTGLQGTQTFQSLIEQIRQVTLDAFAHQGIPLPKLVEALQIDRDLSRSTLFQILFQFKNLPEQNIQTQDISIQEANLKTNIASLDLSLEIKEQTEGLACLFKYDANL
ncbi:MAG: condensation domain-containing protein, partial [Cyanobacteria bacterium J06649_4]